MHTTQTQKRKLKGKQKLRHPLCTSLFKFWSHYLETCIKHKHWHDFMLLDALHKFGIAHSVTASAMHKIETFSIYILCPSRWAHWMQNILRFTAQNYSLPPHDLQSNRNECIASNRTTASCVCVSIFHFDCARQLYQTQANSGWNLNKLQPQWRSMKLIYLFKMKMTTVWSEKSKRNGFSFILWKCWQCHLDQRTITQTSYQNRLNCVIGFGRSVIFSSYRSAGEIQVSTMYDDIRHSTRQQPQLFFIFTNKCNDNDSDTPAAHC